MKNFTLSFNAQHRLTAAKLAAAVALLIACSKISFSIGPVPLTMQTFGVALIGAVLGARLGFSAVLSYLLLGFAGLPVFATPLAVRPLSSADGGLPCRIPVCCRFSRLLSAARLYRKALHCFFLCSERGQHSDCGGRRTLALLHHRSREGDCCWIPSVRNRRVPEVCFRRCRPLCGNLFSKKK